MRQIDIFFVCVLFGVVFIFVGSNDAKLTKALESLERIEQRLELLDGGIPNDQGNGGGDNENS